MLSSRRIYWCFVGWAFSARSVRFLNHEIESMKDPRIDSASWGDPEAIIDDDFRRRSFRNFLTTLGILILVVAIGSGIFVWRQYEQKKTASIEANCQAVAQAIVRHVKSNGIPPAAAVLSEKGEALLSWRVSLLPYLNQRALFDQFDLKSAWDSETNRSLGEIVVPGFQSDRCQRKTPNCTNWVAVLGAKTVIRENRASRNEYARVKNQIAFIELPDSDIPWTQPRDVTIAEAVQLIRNSGEMGGLFCGLGNGGVIRLSAKTGEQELLRLLGE